MMTPQEVANCTFAKATLGGYNMAAVDTFLDKLTEDYSALYKENTALKSKLKVLVDKMAEYREMEDAMRSTLLTAQKMATNMVNEAEKKRDAILASAEEERRKRIGSLEDDQAKEEERLAEVRRRVDQELKGERKRLAVGQKELRSFIQSVQTVCRQELELLERLPELPVEEPEPPAPEPAPEEPTAPVPEARQEEAAPAAGDNVVELGSVEGFAPAGADPFSDEPLPDPDEDISETRIVNLDDLQFGRNYVKD